MIFIVFCGGCSYGQQTCDKIELGRLLTVNGLQPDKEKPEIHNGDRMFVSDVPAIVVTSSVRVMCDGKGYVIAKHFLDNAHGAWFVVRTLSFRWVTELQVPPDLMREAKTVRNPETTIQVAGSTNPEFVPANAVEYIVHILRAMEVRPQEIGPKDIIALPTGFLGCGIFYWWGPGWGQYGHTTYPWLLRDWHQLAGLTKTGFDQTLHTQYGATFRVQNLGNGQIRIEANSFRLHDPFSMAYEGDHSDDILKSADVVRPTVVGGEE